MNTRQQRLERERRWLIMRLHNLGYHDNQIQQYLKTHQQIESHGEKYILKSKLLAIIGRDFDDFLSSFIQQFSRQTSNKVPLKPFLCFLRNGTLPLITDTDTKDTPTRDEISCGYHTPQRQHDANNNTTQIHPINEKSTDAVWKKHETIIQERTVVYVSIDKEGVTHTVTETDKTQKDIIHLENSSGLFAHREYTQQEQTEDMDEEQITCIRASEEYIHLKRDDDEYEYVHSDIPPAPTDYIHDDAHDSDNEENNNNDNDDDDDEL